jgi:hypothetical protein
MNLTRVAVAFLVLAFSQSFCSEPTSQRPEELSQRLQGVIHYYSVRNLSFVEALTQVAHDFQIPMGIEWVKPASGQSPLTLSWTDVPVEQVLQTIVTSEKGYRMDLVGGVVRISPPEIVPDSQNPLKTKIDRFFVQEVPVEVASRRLHDLLVGTITPPTPEQGASGGIGRSGASNLDDPNINLLVRNSTVEDILDSLTLVSARKVWIVTFSDSAALNQGRFRRTLSLWNSAPIPDEEQPVWDMFHWGDSLPKGEKPK